MKKKSFLLCLTLIILLLFSGFIDVTGSDGDGAYETHTITPEGGTHTFDCGITIEVPEGAVTEDTEIQFRKMEKSEIQKILEPLGRESGDILVAFEAKPDGLTLLEDVKVTAQNVGLDPSDFVIMHELDVNNNEYTPAVLSFIYDPAEDIIEFSLNHFSGYSAEELEEMEKSECKNDSENCRCKRIRITQSDKHLICNLGECQKTESKLTVEYLDCKTTETHYLFELDKGCKPEISLTAGSTKVSPKSHTTITTEIILGCEGLEGQVVDFSVSNLSLGSVSPKNSTTNSDGKAQTTFTAGETEGTVTVTVNATVSYYLSVIEANGQTFKGPMKTDIASAEISIEIVEGWNGVFKAGPFSGCNDLVCIQNYSIEVDFTVHELDSVIVDEEAGLEISWMGKATVTQNGNVTPNVSECWIENLYIPGTFSEEAFGSGLKDKNEIGLEFLISILHAHFSYELWIGDAGEEQLVVTGFGLGFAEDVGAGGVGIYFKAPFDGDKATESGQCAMGILGRFPDIWGPYTLTISR
jgi:hypothetical protein